LREFARNLSIPALASQDAINLVYRTGMHESMYMYLKQVNGPALGFFQIEPATLRDLVDWLFYNNHKFEAEVKYLCGERWLEEPEMEMQTNIKFMIIMCRLYYWRKPGKIPSTIIGQAEYWKKHYNTHLGKGTVAAFVDNATRQEAYHV
jgi:hypothetical protein